MKSKLTKSTKRFSLPSGEAVLFLAALLACVVNNSPAASIYSHFFQSAHGAFSPLLWINEGLMTFFFLLMGLELRHAFSSSQKNASYSLRLSAVAAIGGMLVPALIYWFFNADNPQALRGWAIPMATDVAFSLAVLRSLGPRISLELQQFLMALAVFDDLGAILVIALFYPQQLVFSYLFGVVICGGVLWILARRPEVGFSYYLLLGTLLWWLLLKTGIHATLAGVAVGLSIAPQNPWLQKCKPHLERWVAYCVLPLFAFANAGIDFSTLFATKLAWGIILGIAFGLLLGKPLGILIMMAPFYYLGLKHRPAWMTLKAFLGLGFAAGIGFTVSLFMGDLAFAGSMSDLAAMRLGVLAGSLASGSLCFFYFTLKYTKE